MRMKNLNQNATSIVVIMITGTICAALLLMFLSQLVNGSTWSESKAKLVAGIVTSLISIVSVFVGSKLNSNK